LIGVSRISQLEDSVAAVQKLNLSPEELDQIEAVLAG
jgi:aryl-alcohol dehydrogenase-like predicted oxidoreductase